MNIKELRKKKKTERIEAYKKIYDRTTKAINDAVEKEKPYKDPIEEKKSKEDFVTNFLGDEYSDKEKKLPTKEDIKALNDKLYKGELRDLAHLKKTEDHLDDFWEDEAEDYI